jgi:Lon-like protease
MTQRTWAGLLAVPLLLALWAIALTAPLPFVTYEPGLTVDVLDDPDGQEIIQIDGHKTYRDDGELRLTTVYVTRPESDVNLLQLMEGWISTDDAVYPKRAVYPRRTRRSPSRSTRWVSTSRRSPRSSLWGMAPLRPARSRWGTAWSR